MFFIHVLRCCGVLFFFLNLFFQICAPTLGFFFICLQFGEFFQNVLVFVLRVFVLQIGVGNIYFNQCFLRVLHIVLQNFFFCLHIIKLVIILSAVYRMFKIEASFLYLITSAESYGCSCGYAVKMPRTCPRRFTYDTLVSICRIRIANG